MERRAFNQLPEEQFRVRMRHHAMAIYQQLFPGCAINDLRADGVAVHVLDKEFAIDTLATLPSGQWLSIQEKYRRHKFLAESRLQVSPPMPDFTQEYKNAAGTPHEENGEWFKLGAQLYFYGWATADESGFAKWILLDIAKYKILVERAGGLHAIGQLHNNNVCGRASFYAIPIDRLKPAWLASHAHPYITTKPTRDNLCAAPSSDWEHIASIGSKSDSVVPSRGNSEVQGCQRTGIQDEVCRPPERKLPDVEVCGVRDRNKTPDGLDGAVPHHMNTRQ